MATPSQELQIQPPHAGIHLVGAKFFPQPGVTVAASSGISVGDGCTLESEDHYHVKLITVDVDSLMKALANNKPALSALKALAKDPDDSGAVTQFQREIKPPETPEAPTVYRQQLSPDLPVVITESANIQCGNNSTMRQTNKYSIRESALPLVDILATNRNLVKKLAESFGDPTSFDLRTAIVKAAGHADDHAILCGATRIDSAPATVLYDRAGNGTKVDGAVNGVMIGAGNRLRHVLEVKHPGVKIGDLSTAVEEIRTLAGIEIPQPGTRFDLRDLSNSPETSTLPRPGHDPPEREPPPPPKPPDDPDIRFPGLGL